MLYIMFPNLIFQNTSKPRFRFTENEWLNYNKNQFLMTREQGVKAEKILEESDRIRERVKEIILKRKNETEWKIQGRIKDIYFVKEELENIRKSILEELEAMTILQERIQNEIQYVNSNALNIVEKCIHFRKGRTDIDLIYDEVEEELEKESKKIKEADVLLEKNLEQTKESKRDLRASLYLLNKDLEGKLSCLTIENECLNLKETNMDLYIYHENQPFDESNITVEEWAHYSQEIILSSEKKIQEARIFQSHVKNILEEVITDLRDQYFAVNDAFQRRILEVKEAKTRLENHHFEITQQVNKMTQNITELERAIQEKEGFIALAQNRLEKRSSRPGIELVKDSVEASLLKELADIKTSVLQLQLMLSEAKINLRCLLKTQIKFEEEINVKTNSLKIDEVDCATLRQVQRLAFGMVKLFPSLKNITTGRQLYKHLLKECRRLPPQASQHYKHSIKQSFKQHLDESNPERVQEIIDRALQDAAWVIDKYNNKKKI